MVDHYRKGRVFVGGDAAHIHSPSGGQGMNTGIQDAYNLAWKLVLVVRGKAAPSLLDTYEEERMPVARAVLNQTDTNQRLFMSNAWYQLPWLFPGTKLRGAADPNDVAVKQGERTDKRARQARLSSRTARRGPRS